MRNPYKLIISPPIIGKTSGQKVLACSTGILDSTGKYMGTINAGVNINELAMKLTQLTATTNIKFHILNLKNEIFVSSIDTPPSIASFEKSPKPEVWRPSQKKGFMMIKPVRYKIPNYPLMVAAFYDDAYLLNTFLGIFIPHLLQFIGIFIIGFSLLLLFQKRYIKPIILLSLQAEELAKGRLAVNRLKQTNTSEIINLYKTLLQVKRYVAKNHRSQKKINKKNQELRVVNNLLIQKKQELEITQNDLQKAIRIAEESDNSKRRFIKQIKDELKAPLASILFVTEYLLEQVDDVDIQSYLNHIHQSATELKSLIRTQLCLEAINILELINESLVIHQKYAYKKQVEIKRDIQKDIPLFKADKLRFKQAIVGLLYRAIDNSPQGKPVSIACHLQQDSSQAPCLKIWITDAGFGLSAIAEQRIQSLLDTHSDDTELEIETIRRLIELHNGKLQIQRENGKGTHYVILLPLDVDKLALTPKNNVYSFVTNKTVN
jgi:signal transduction histidine kinase